jgi:hypothetical protein
MAREGLPRPAIARATRISTVQGSGKTDDRSRVPVERDCLLASRRSSARSSRRQREAGSPTRGLEVPCSSQARSPSRPGPSRLARHRAHETSVNPSETRVRTQLERLPETARHDGASAARTASERPGTTTPCRYAGIGVRLGRLREAVGPMEGPERRRISLVKRVWRSWGEARSRSRDRQPFPSDRSSSDRSAPCEWHGTRLIDSTGP